MSYRVRYCGTDLNPHTTRPFRTREQAREFIEYCRRYHASFGREVSATLERLHKGKWHQVAP